MKDCLVFAQTFDSATGLANLQPMRLLAPAKINLHLRVGPIGADGFHPLLSWMVTVGLFDTLTFEPRAAAGIEFACSDGSLPTDERNLVLRAAKLLQSAHGAAVSSRGASIHLEKSIPSAAGLGGGSSDAARTLLGLNRLWNVRLARVQLLQFAAQLGSDVPFFLFEPSSICTGRGDIVRPIARPAVRFAVLIFPGIAMPTARVYESFDRRPSVKVDALCDQPDWQAWTSLSADELLPRLVNNLEPAAFEISPELGILRWQLEQRLRRIVRMSGSGSTLFTLFDDEQAAEAALVRIQEMKVRAAVVEIAPKIPDGLHDALDHA